MPKLAIGVVSTTLFFNFNNLDYAAGDYLIVYNNVEADSSGDPIQATLAIGLQNKFTGRNFQVPTNFSNWTDGADAPYATLALLLAAMNTFNVLQPA